MQALIACIVAARIRSQTGYRRRSGGRGGKPAVVIDLFSRKVIGWSMGTRIDTDSVLSTADGVLAQTTPGIRYRCIWIRGASSRDMPDKPFSVITTWSAA